MVERRIRLSKDKLEFLEGWKEEKRDHLQEILQHVADEEELHNHTHLIDSNTHDIFFTALTLLPPDLTKKVLSECVFFTCYLSDYEVGHFFHKSDLSGYHLIILLFPHGESIPKYWSYIHHEIARFILGQSSPETDERAVAVDEAAVNSLACQWMRESPYTVPRDSFAQCSCPDGIIRFCKALATAT